MLGVESTLRFLATSKMDTLAFQDGDRLDELPKGVLVVTLPVVQPAECMEG